MPRALIFEAESLIAERVRHMAVEAGYITCLIDAAAMFHELLGNLRFDLYLVGIRSSSELQALQDISSLDPLVLLASTQPKLDAAHLRVALPQARVMDRALRDPDALRRALEPVTPTPNPSPPSDTIRRTFGPFGLSERQLDVLGLALRGAASAEIAAELYISELTVRNHLHAIYERVGVTGHRELMGRFVRGLLEATA